MFLWVFGCCVVGFLWILTGRVLHLESYSNYIGSHGELAILMFSGSQGLIGGIAYGMTILLKRRLLFSKFEHLLNGSIAAVPIVAFYFFVVFRHLSDLAHYLDWLVHPLSSVVMGLVTTAYLKGESKSAQKAA